MDYTVLAQTELFLGLEPREVEALLGCLGAYERTYARGEQVMRVGDVTEHVGVVVSGSVNVVVNYYWGDRAIFGHIYAGQVFAETYAALPKRRMLVDIVAAEDADVVFVAMPKLIRTCGKSCPFHHEAIENLVRLSAERSLALARRMMHIAPRTIRERVLSYLSDQATRVGSDRFTVPFSRQQLADYLGVDRSALSHELSKMQHEGLIVTRRSYFELKRDAWGER